jgi:putative transposase
MEQFQMSERRACKLVDLDRSSYRYERRADRNAHLRQELLSLARQKWRYGYRRLHALLVRRGHRTSPQRLYRLYKEEHLAVRRIRRKRLMRPAMAPLRLCCANQEWALDFVCDALSTGRSIRVLNHGYIYPGVSGTGDRYELIEPTSDAGAGANHRAARSSASDPL